MIGSRSPLAPRSRRRAAPARTLAPALAFVLALVFAPATADAVSPYRRGQTIDLSGTVTDSSGGPVEGVTVVLLASHRGFEMRTLRRIEKGLVRVPTTTDRDGRFSITWRWNPYYDTFRLRAEGGSPARATGGSTPRPVLAEVDVGSRMLEGSPVVVALEVGAPVPRPVERASAGASSPPATSASTATSSGPKDRTSAPVERSSEPPSGPAPEPAATGAEPSADQSADQERIFDQMGKPDRVDRLAVAGGEEVAWWYFEHGRSYHFRDGRLEQVMQFDPVDRP